VRFRRIFSGFISLTAIPAFGGACAGARYRAAAIRPCLGCASVAGVMLKRFAIYHRLPRYARLAIEARPLGRARAGPAEGRNSRERYEKFQPEFNML